MKFMLMIYEDDADRVEHMDERMPTCSAYAQAMIKAGIYVGGDRLRGADTATTVRVTDGRTEVVDGPWAEAREQLGGFHIIDVPDLDAALAWAARIPAAPGSVIEIRPNLVPPPAAIRILRVTAATPPAPRRCRARRSGSGRPRRARCRGRARR